MDLRSKFQTIEKDRCPIQMRNVILQPSRKHGEKDVMYTHKSKWSCLTSLDFPYNPTITATTQDNTINQILEMETEYQRLNVKAKCVGLESQGHNILQDDTFLEKTNYTIADTTGAIELAVWGLQHTLKLESWFNMTNLSLRMFKGIKFLSTTKDTNISPITCTDTTFPIPPTTSEDITAGIVGAKVNIIYICPLKHVLKDIPLSCSRILCNRCDIFYKSETILLHTQARLTIKTQTSDNMKTVNIENNIRSMVKIPHTATTDMITDLLLDLPTMHMTIHNDCITHLKYEEPSHTNIHQETTPLITLSPATHAQAISREANDDFDKLDLFMDDHTTDIQQKTQADTQPGPSVTSVISDTQNSNVPSQKFSKCSFFSKIEYYKDYAVFFLCMTFKQMLNS